MSVFYFFFIRKRLISKNILCFQKFSFDFEKLAEKKGFCVTKILTMYFKFSSTNESIRQFVLNIRRSLRIIVFVRYQKTDSLAQTRIQRNKKKNVFQSNIVMSLSYIRKFLYLSSHVFYTVIGFENCIFKKKFYLFSTQIISLYCIKKTLSKLS